MTVGGGKDKRGQIGCAEFNVICACCLWCKAWLGLRRRGEEKREAEGGGIVQEADRIGQFNNKLGEPRRRLRRRGSSDRKSLPAKLRGDESRVQETQRLKFKEPRCSDTKMLH